MKIYQRLLIRFPVLEGDKVIKEVDKDGKNVHPVPPPKRIKIEELFTLGYTTSGEA